MNQQVATQDSQSSSEGESPVVDTTQPGDKWEFDADVAKCFDNMLERSIPQYRVMRKACLDVGIKHLKGNSHVVDLGCSRGGALAGFVEHTKSCIRFLGLEISDPMIEEATARFADNSDVKIEKLDLRTEYPYRVDACVTLAVLVLQFTPIEHRHKIVQNIYDSTLNGGCVILVEKILGQNAKSDELLVDLYYKHKKEQGYTQEDIDRKRLSLEGVLVPVTEKWNREFLEDAGFKEVECFWRWMNFAAWVGVKRA